MANISPGVSGQIGSEIGGAVSDLFTGFGDIYKMKGLEAEQQQYEIAAQEASQQAHYTLVSGAIQQAQSNRELYLSTGRTTSEVAGAGFAASGSALDILRSSASQGALKSAAIGQQTQIQAQSLEEQAQSYEAMANATGEAAKESNLASIGSFISAGISGATAGATGYLALAALA
jgi:hydroxyethylthiazole kinase-like sugar kinase family protein